MCNMPKQRLFTQIPILQPRKVSMKGQMDRRMDRQMGTTKRMITPASWFNN